MPDAHRLGFACVTLALLTSLSSARAQDAAPKAAPDAQPPVNLGPVDPPAPGEAAAPGDVATAVPALDGAVLESLLVKLDDPSIAEREHAMAALRGLPGVTVRAIEQVLGKPTLSAEQRVRLLQVGRALFMSEPRAAMGVSFTQGMMEDEDGQVQVSEPTPGWDSARVLRAWDVIRSIDGLRLRTRAEARAAIISHDPGDTVSLDILRNGQPGTVRVRLGNFIDLGSRGFIDAATFEAAWRLRAARSIADGSKPLVIDVAAEEWSSEPAGDGLSRMERMNHPITSEPLRTQMRQIPVSDVSASGPSRATGEREVDEFGQAGLTIRSGPAVRMRGENRRGGMPPEFARAIVESNRRLRDSLIQKIAMWRQMAADPSIDAKQAAELRFRADQYERRVAQLEVDILEQERDAGDR